MYIGDLPAAASPYSDLINNASQLAGNVEPELIAAHIMAESSFNPNATHTDTDGGVSYGLMQVRLDTARRLLGIPALTGGQLLDPLTNIISGTKVIQGNLVQYGNLPDAIAAYNAGVPRQNAQGQYTNSKGNTNVQTYVDRVLGYYQQYKAGSAPVQGDVASLEAGGSGGFGGLWAIPAALLIGLVFFGILNRKK